MHIPSEYLKGETGPGDGIVFYVMLAMIEHMDEKPHKGFKALVYNGINETISIWWDNLRVLG